MAKFRAKGKPATPSPLVRPRPARNGSFVAFAARDDGFCAYVHRDVLERIEAHAQQGGHNEVIGLLAGRICQDLQRVPYTLVMAAEGAVGGEATSEPGSVHISPEGRASVSHRLIDSHPDREIVGWYHSHPHGSPHFSTPDTKEQAGWTDPNHIGIVVAVRGREGLPAARNAEDAFGVYRGPGAVRLTRLAPSQAARAARNIVIRDATSKAARQSHAREQERAASAAIEPAAVGHAPPAAGAQEHPAANSTVQSAEAATARRASEPYVLRIVMLLAAPAVLIALVWMHVRIRTVELAQRTTGDVDVIETASPAVPSSSSASTSTVAPAPAVSSQSTPAVEQSPGHAETDAGTASMPLVAGAPAFSVPANPIRPERDTAAQRRSRDREKAAEEAEAKRAREKAAKAREKASRKATEKAQAAPKATDTAKESNRSNSEGETQNNQQTPNAAPAAGTRHRAVSPTPTPEH